MLMKVNPFLWFFQKCVPRERERERKRERQRQRQRQTERERERKGETLFFCDF